MCCKVGRQQKAQGFTLVELLVALFVFSLLSAFAYRAINTMVKTGDAVEAEMTALSNVQRAVQTIERDLRQKAVPVIATTDTEAIDNTNADPSQLELTIIANSATSAKPTLKRIRYSLKDKNLIKETWVNNKASSETPDDVAVLLKNVSKVEFAALDQAAATTSNSWPAYFQLALEQEDLGLVKRTIYFGVNKPDLAFSSLTEKDPDGSGDPNDPDRTLCQGATRDCVKK